MFIDTHAHFDLCIEAHNTSIDTIFEMMESANVTSAVHIVIDLNGFEWGVNFVQTHKDKNLFIAFGIHPSSIADPHTLSAFEKNIDTYIPLLSHKIFGIGEAGLDYYRMRQPKAMQQESFHFQLRLAKKYNLPIIIHSRDAMDDTYAILKQYIPLNGIIHCFSGDHNDARRFLDIGMFISFAGNVTYKKASHLHSAVAYVPLDRLLIETDAPFLTPEPLRGKQNHPGLVIHTYKFISDIKRIPLSNCIDNIAQNFNTLCSIRKYVPNNEQ